MEAMRTPFMNIRGGPQRSRPALGTSLAGASAGVRLAPGHATLGYLASLAAAQDSGIPLPDYLVRLLSVYKTYKHDPEVAIYTTEVVMSYMRPKEGEESPYLYPVDNIQRDITFERQAAELVPVQEAAQYLRRDLLNREEVRRPPPIPNRARGDSPAETQEEANARTGWVEGDTWIAPVPRHFLWKTQTRGDDVYDALPETGPKLAPLIPWMGREIGRMLKMLRKGRDIPLLVDDQVRGPHTAKVYDVPHLLQQYPKEQRPLSENERIFRQNLKTLANTTRLGLIEDWYTATGPAAPLHVRLRDDEGQNHDLPMRRQPGVDWGEELDIGRYSWSQAYAGAVEWHRVDEARKGQFRRAQRDIARRQPKDVMSVVHDGLPEGWHVEELDSDHKMIMEGDGLTHCIDSADYRDARWRPADGPPQPAQQRNLSFRAPIPMPGAYAPRHTVNLVWTNDVWRVRQIKGDHNALPPQFSNEDRDVSHEAGVIRCNRIATVLQEIDPDFRNIADWNPCRRVLVEEERRQAEALRRQEREED